jgi:ABC-2 type transport system permease protein
MFFLAFLVAGSLKNIYIVQTINILIFILSFLFGDFLIDLSYATTTPAIIIGYFIPQKYIT